MPLGKTADTHRQADLPSGWVICFLVLSGIILALTLALPFIEDNIPQAYIAEMLLHGKFPYVGTWDQNYPGVLIFHLLALIFSSSVFSFHSVDLVFEFLMLWILFRIGTRLESRLAGVLAALLYSLYYALNGADDLMGQKDVFAAIALCVALWILFRSNYKSLVFSGIVAGLAVLIRPTYGLHVLVLGAGVFAGSSTRRLTRVLSFLVSSALPFLIFCLVYAIAGHLADFWNATFVFTTSVYNPRPRLGILYAPVLYRGFIPAFALLGSIVLVARPQWRKEGILIVTLFCASLASALLLWGYRYHWQPYFVFEFVLAAVGIGHLFRWIVSFVFPRRAWVFNGIAAVFLLTIIVFNFKGSTMSRFMRDLVHGKVSTRQKAYGYFSNEAFDPVNEDRLANYLRTTARHGDKMESFYTTVYPQYIAGLEPANRFILTIPLVMRRPDGSFTPMQRQWQKEYSDSMLSVRPKYFLISDPVDTSGIGEGGRLPRQMLHETFPIVEAMIDESYHRDTTIGIWTLYARN